MKGKSVLYSITAIGFAGMLIFSSCKKKEDKKTEEQQPVVQTPDTQGSTDNRDVQDENDQATQEINEIISNSNRTAGRSSSTQETAGITSICGFDVDSVKIAQDTILFKYNGITCANRTRTGMIRLTWAHGTKWQNQNAVIKIEYLNYKVVRASDQRFITLNGTQYLKNESGGTWINLLLGQALVNTITGTNLQATFINNKTAVYNINRRLTYTYATVNSVGILTAKAEGIGSNNGLNNLENYGTTRDGDTFTSQVSTPIIWNTTCAGAVIQGVVSVKNVTKNLELKFTYGVDSNGNPMTVGPNACPYGWKLDWTTSGQSYSKVFGYY